MAVFADFLRVSGIPGEARDNRHQGEIEVLSWSWGLTETPAPGPGPGGAVRPAFDEVSVEKNVDKASALLAQACAAGTHLQEATVSTQQSLGPGVAVDMFVLRLWDVTIRKFHKAATPLSVSPTEAISIAFTKAEFTYIPRKTDGSADTAVRWGWDLKAGRPF